MGPLRRVRPWPRQTPNRSIWCNSFLPKSLVQRWQAYCAMLSSSKKELKRDRKGTLLVQSGREVEGPRVGAKAARGRNCLCCKAKARQLHSASNESKLQDSRLLNIPKFFVAHSCFKTARNSLASRKSRLSWSCTASLPRSRWLRGSSAVTCPTNSSRRPAHREILHF